MKNKLDAFPHQIDFKTNHTPSLEVMGWIMENSSRVEHLLDEEPRISRWWFEDIGKALEAVNRIIEEDPAAEYRWLCLELDALIMQHGDF
ncbi:MAG: hypothetical protein AAF039_09805 [Bacteroidota bacterium]